MSFKRIGAALMAVVISAGAFTVPAFAFTDESAAADTAIVQDVTAMDTGEEKATETEQAEDTESTEKVPITLDSLPFDPELLAMILPEIDDETINFLMEHPKLLAAFIPTLHVTVTNHSVIITVDGYEEEKPVQAGTVTTNGSCLNVRNGASTDYDIIGQLKNGSEITIKGEKDGWYQIEFPAEFAYVCGNYVKLKDIPVKETEEGTTFDIDGKMILSFIQMIESYFPETTEAVSHGLTPSGNLTLVDDYGSSTGEGQQFVTLVSKAGNYFYLVIDRDEKGNENVHFLNQVDEADLFALMDEDEAAAMKEQIAAEEAARQQAEQPTVTPTEPTEPSEEQEPQKEEPKSKLPYAVGLIALVGVCGAGGAFFFMKNKKQQAAESERPDPDADYREDDDGYDIPEESEDEEEYDESEES